MSPELDDALCKKYPKIFRDRHGDSRTTAMCWGFECGDGWYAILDDLCSKIQEVCDRKGYQVVASQVKEKFGTLRFYTIESCDEVDALIRDAERDTEITCEVCGKPGELETKGWWSVRCEEHRGN